MQTEPTLQILSRRQEMTVRQYAQREGVAPITVYRWLQKGAVPFRKTPGGGIRITDTPVDAHVRLRRTT